MTSLIIKLTDQATHMREEIHSFIINPHFQVQLLSDMGHYQKYAQPVYFSGLGNANVWRQAVLLLLWP